MYSIAKGEGLDRVEGCFITRDVCVCLVTIRRAVRIIILRVSGDLVVYTESTLRLVDSSRRFDVVPELYLILLLGNRVEMVDAVDSGSVMTSLN